MKTPTFNILLSSNSAKSQVTCNGEDISGSIRSIKVEQVSGELPIVTLVLLGGSRGASVRAQCEAILKLQDTVEAPDAPTEPQLNHSFYPIAMK